MRIGVEPPPAAARTNSPTPTFALGDHAIDRRTDPERIHQQPGLVAVDLGDLQPLVDHFRCRPCRLVPGRSGLHVGLGHDELRPGCADIGFLGAQPIPFFLAHPGETVPFSMSWTMRACWRWR